MSALSDLQKKLEKEAQGIMFPFSAKTPTVDTKQEVYNSATDGIMTMQGQKYVGPDSVIQYTPEGQRQLKEIEKGMLPQFDQEQFPDVGQGKVEDRGGTTPFTPTTSTTPSTFQTQTPTFDPCPPGFIFDRQLQRCVPIEQPSDRNESIKLDTRTNNEKAADILDDYGIKLTGEGGIFADPEKTKSVFGEFGKLPTFTQKDFEGGLPFYVPFSGIINEIIKYSNISQLKNLGVINETSKGNYQLTKNGIRAVVQSSIDKDKPRMERSLKQQGFTQKQIDSGQALAEMRKTDRYNDIPEDKLTASQKRAREEAEKQENKRVKEYQERESKKYTDKQKNDFMKEVNKVRFKDIGGLKQIKSDKFTGEGFTRGR